MLTEEEKKTGMFLRIQGLMGIWVNLNDGDVLKCMDTYIQNKLFAERKAQTIAERNCLKKHPSLAQVYVDATGTDYNHVGSVDVIGYNHDLTREDLLKLAQMAEQGENLGEYKGIKVDFIDANVIDEVTPEDVMTSRDEEEAPLEITDTATGAGTPMQQVKIPEKEKVPATNENKESLLEELEAGKDFLGDEAFNKMIEDNFKKPLEQLTVQQLNMAKTLINSAVDQGGEF